MGDCRKTIADEFPRIEIADAQYPNPAVLRGTRGVAEEKVLSQIVQTVAPVA